MSNKLALLIGINYRNSKAELNGCINDVILMKNILISKFGYLEKNIILLTDDTNIKPTKKNIIDYIQQLVDKSNNGINEFWLHYSGHGTNIKDLNGDENDGYDEVIVPLDYDKGIITDDQLYQILQNLHKNSRMFCIMDCCHSGTILDLQYKLNNNNYWHKVGKQSNNNICMISGCQDNQTSADAFIPFSNNQYLWRGAMTWAFIQTLKKYRYRINLITLINHMKYLLKTNGYSQIPQLSSSNRVNIHTYINDYMRKKKIIVYRKKLG